MIPYAFIRIIDARDTRQGGGKGQETRKSSGRPYNGQHALNREIQTMVKPRLFSVLAVFSVVQTGGSGKAAEMP
jgi:hypothetical protein